MKVLNKELIKDLELSDIQYILEANYNEKFPIAFLNGNTSSEGKSDLITVKTNLNFTQEENEIKFLLVPDTFIFSSKYYDDAIEPDMKSLQADFISQYTNRLRKISYLPDDILKQIKDKRLLALGYAERKVKNTIIKYIRARKKAAIGTLDKSTADTLENAKSLTIEKQFETHSSIDSMVELFDEVTITKINKRDCKIYIQLNGEETIVLSEAQTLEEEVSPENAYIKYFELHKTGQRFELHLLLMTRGENFIEEFHYATYAFTDMQFCN